MDETQITDCQFVEASKDASVVLDLVDKTLDQMPFSIEPGIVLALELGRLMRRDDRLGAQGLDVGDERRARIAAISDHALEREAVQQRDGLGAVVALTCCQQRP